MSKERRTRQIGGSDGEYFRVQLSVRNLSGTLKEGELQQAALRAGFHPIKILDTAQQQNHQVTDGEMSSARIIPSARDQDLPKPAQWPQLEITVDTTAIIRSVTQENNMTAAEEEKIIERLNTEITERIYQAGLSQLETYTWKDSWKKDIRQMLAYCGALLIFYTILTKSYPDLSIITAATFIAVLAQTLSVQVKAALISYNLEGDLPYRSDYFNTSNCGRRRDLNKITRAKIITYQPQVQPTHQRR